MSNRKNYHYSINLSKALNNYIYLKAVLIIVFVFNTNISFSQFLYPVKDTNFYDIVKHYGDTISPPTSKQYTDGPYEQYHEWYSYWSPRLFPTGSFNVAANAWKNYIQNQQNNTSSANRTSSTNNPVSAWSEIGPNTTDGGTGEMTRIAFHPSFTGTGTGNTNTIYAASQGGGVWVSSNGGSNWSNLNTDQQFSFLCVRALAIDPNLNSSLPIPYHDIFAGTGDGQGVLSNGIYRSQDGGTNWLTVNTGLFSLPTLNSIKQFAFNPNLSGELFAATSQGLYHTTSSDGACNWSLVSTPSFPYPSSSSVYAPNNMYIQDVKYHPSIAGTLYASGYDIYISTDDGATWTSMTGPGTGLDLNQGVQPGINGDQNPIQSINIGVTKDPTGINYVYANIYQQMVPMPQLQ